MGALSQLFHHDRYHGSADHDGDAATLRWALSRLPMRKDEAAARARGKWKPGLCAKTGAAVVGAVERENNAKFATRIAGLIAGGSVMPTTGVT